MVFFTVNGHFNLYPSWVALMEPLFMVYHEGNFELFIAYHKFDKPHWTHDLIDFFKLFLIS